MTLKELKLEKQVAIITACGHSWVKELALSLAEAGAKIVIAANDPGDLPSIAQALQNAGLDVIVIPVNLACTGEVEKMVEQVIDRFAKIDILVNNLNLEFWKPLLDMSEKEWHHVIDTNLTSAFLCSKVVGRYMVKQKTGRIINIISGLAERGIPNGIAYCASMGGILQLTRTISLEWARYNIRVNAIGFGWMEQHPSDPKMDGVEHYIPMRRLGKADDIAPLVVFLASEASSYLNGNIYIVDGGLMARG